MERHKYKIRFIGKVSSNKRVSIPSRIADIKDGDTVLVTVERYSGEEDIEK